VIREWVEANRGSWLERPDGSSASFAEVGSVPWPAVIEVDREFGGLSLWLGEREVWVGLDSALEMPGFHRVLDGRPHVLVGVCGAWRWYVDEQGAVMEVDGDGAVLSRAESVRVMLERLALAG